MLIPVDDAADPRLADYVRLRDVDLRRSLEGERGLFVAEGEKVIRRAVGAGYPVRSVLTTPKWLDHLADVIADVTVYVVTDEVMEGITGFRVHRGALASMERLRPPSVAELLAGGGSSADAPRRILLLEDLVDHGNVGAVFRCAAALGVGAIVLSPRCADPLYRRSVKVSMGAVFAIPWARMDDWHGGLAEVRSAGFRLLALTPDQSAVPLDEAPLDGPVALMLGSEGDGLSSHWLKEADAPVCIRMSPQAMDLGVDSLNVVAAAAIACHGLMRNG
ncbi:TrmH family RNA methyltransferase [Microbispora sp. ATCC PTA-5024]|uniref:TrmH family RNA methyltransferase n=1 Tax=Microbispora sp. ATCC PTA-5024 TaxID=316330 RepID=UPI0003DC57DB|nr:RNA methyltransferase [Microbispora sp. ATCC PTA-5024]ETK31560.1 rRNA methyltransferase [Microbispora sp. ATCC PTA-5024]